jgi:hypothetical protein
MAVVEASLANLKPFVPGQSANPGGRPVGSRNAINAKFLNALITAFDEGDEEGHCKGLRAIKRCRDEDPSAFVKALIALQPKEVDIKRNLDDIPDDQLAAAYAAVGAILAAQNPAAGVGAAEGAQQAQGLPAVSETG